MAMEGKILRKGLVLRPEWKMPQERSKVDLHTVGLWSIVINPSVCLLVCVSLELLDQSSQNFVN